MGPNSKGFAYSRTLFSITLTVVDQVTEVTWQKPGKNKGPRKKPSPVACALGLPLTCWFVYGYTVGTQDSEVVVRHRCDKSDGDTQLLVSSLSHSRPAWKSRATQPAAGNSTLYQRRKKVERTRWRMTGNLRGCSPVVPRCLTQMMYPEYTFILMRTFLHDFFLKHIKKLH